MKGLVNLFVILIFISFPLLADEGMWMPHQMKNLDLEKYGLQMKPDDLFKKDGTGLMSAVVSLGGGTGEFVSAEGLILTNHHVAFGALQRASDPEHNYIDDGFVAWEETEEIPAQGYIADVLLGYHEVTGKVLADLKNDMTPLEKYYAIDKAKKELIAEAESKAADLQCRIAAMYSGNKYYLFKFKRLKDIRIVYAPPRDLGNFGGDIDNWMWPRHTCDFSFLRAYVSKNNIGVDYSEDNVPYQPKSIIKISEGDLKDGDFTFVMGYPGKTYRNDTVSELEFSIDYMKRSIKLRQEMIAFFEQAGKEDKVVEIKYARKLKGLNNGLKNYQGKLEGFESADIIDKKQMAETEFMNWVQKDNKRHKKYGDILSKIASFMKRYTEYYTKQQRLSYLVNRYYGSAMLSQAHLIYRTVQQRAKPDMERDSYYQERSFPRLKMSVKLAERGYELQTDRTFLTHQLLKMLQLPEDQIPKAFRQLMAQKSEAAIKQYVDELYSNTVLTDADKRLEMLDLFPTELAAIDDPFIKLAEQLEYEIKDLREQGRSLGQELDDMKKVYLEAMLKMKDGNMAPDANGTIRFTYGEVAGYSPRDAVHYQPLTTLTGVIEKDTGEFPFHVPEKLKALYNEKDFGNYITADLNDVPCCFLNTTNVTGGSSGSPTLNANGEQVGIIFDMTYESVIGDYYIIPELQRTISVDIRYVLFITDKFSGAQHILTEIGLK